MKQLLLFLLVFADCVFADSYFRIANIEIKRSGKNSLEAKQNALSIASRSALKKLVKDEFKADENIIDLIHDRQIQDCVYDYSVEKEKYSDSVYIAEFSYRFCKKKVCKLLSSCGIKSDIAEENDKREIKVAVYAQDFIRCFKDFKKLHISTEKFSNKIVIFRMDKDRVGDLRELRIKYAPL